MSEAVFDAHGYRCGLLMGPAQLLEDWGTRRCVALVAPSGELVLPLPVFAQIVLEVVRREAEREDSRP